MHKKAGLLLLLLLVATYSFAQTTYLPLGSDDYLLLDRLETRSGRLSDSLSLNNKAESRKEAVNFLEMISAKDSTDKTRYSTIDIYNMRQMLSENGEWAHSDDAFIKSKHPLFKTFYRTPYDMVSIRRKDLFLAINPILSVMNTSENNSPVIKGTSTNLMYNNHNMEIRACIGKKLGVYINYNENSEQLPSYFYDYTVKPGNRLGLPGAAYALLPKNRSSAFGYINSTGYIDFAAVKEKVNVTFGSGKFFIGDGTTSLFLTDFSSNMPFLRLRARIWRINYETIYLELTEQFKRDKDTNYPHKFATIHSISYNAARWLNLGFYEAVVFDRPNAYELSYLNPVILINSVNSFNGRGDKSLLGFYGKIIAARHFQLYGQFMLNEFKSSEFFSNKGWYGNKWGIQAGAKYFDAFGIRNLDLQAEMNAVRPYSYTAQDTLANYTNYNQPLADPLGAGFIKTVGIIRYQPLRNVTITAKVMNYTHGVDTGNANLGNDIFKPYVTAPKGSNTYGVKLINGPENKVSSLNINLSYQARRNLFIDIGAIYRKSTTAANGYPNGSTLGYNYGDLSTRLIYFGLRLNAPRRDYSTF